MKTKLTPEEVGQLHEWADWLEELWEDDEGWQGHGELADDSGRMCCLGVAACIGIADVDRGCQYAPGMVEPFCRMDQGELPTGELITLANINDDDNWSFAEIATLVRRYADTGDFDAALEYAKADREDCMAEVLHD
jgi:hypothetical protein